MQNRTRGNGSPADGNHRSGTTTGRGGVRVGFHDFSEACEMPNTSEAPTGTCSTSSGTIASREEFMTNRNFVHLVDASSGQAPESMLIVGPACERPAVPRFAERKRLQFDFQTAVQLSGAGSGDFLQDAQPGLLAALAPGRLAAQVERALSFHKQTPA